MHAFAFFPDQSCALKYCKMFGNRRLRHFKPRRNIPRAQMGFRDIGQNPAPLGLGVLGHIRAHYPVFDGAMVHFWHKSGHQSWRIKRPACPRLKPAASWTNYLLLGPSRQQPCPSPLRKTGPRGRSDRPWVLVHQNTGKIGAGPEHSVAAGRPPD
jgi:hypothetical protein